MKGGDGRAGCSLLPSPFVLWAAAMRRRSARQTCRPSARRNELFDSFSGQWPVVPIARFEIAACIVGGQVFCLEDFTVNSLAINNLTPYSWTSRTPSGFCKEEGEGGVLLGVGDSL